MKTNSIRPSLLLLSLFSFLLLNQASAQDCDVLFHYFAGGSTKPVLTELTADGGYLIAGSTTDFGANGFDFQVIKVDQFGNETWSNLYGTADDEIATDIEVLDDGYLVLGYSELSFDESRAYLIRLDFNGNLLWQQFFGDGSDGIKANAMMIDNEENVVIACKRIIDNWPPQSEAKVYKTDLSGNLIDEQAFNFWIPEFENITLFEGFGNMGASAVTQLSDGNYLFTGLTVPRVNFFPIKGHTIVFKTDQNLNTLWSRDHYTCNTCNCQADGRKVVEDDQGNLYLAVASNWNGCYDEIYTYLEVLKLDSLGNHLWDTGFTTVGNAYDILIATDGNPVVTSNSGLLKLSTAGDLLWEKAFENTHWTRGSNSLQQKTDGGFVIAGYRYSAGGEIFLALTDSLGNSCTNLLEGHVFFDENANCLFDSSEHVLPQFLVELNPGPLFDLSDESGYYSFVTDSGNYTVTIHPINDLWTAACPGSQTYDVYFTGFYESSDSTDFAMIPADICPLLDIDMSWNNSRVCNEGTILIQYCNFGAATEENLSINLELPVELTFLGANIPWTQNGNTYTFDLGNLEVGACGTLMIQDSVNCAAQLGEVVCLSVQAFPDDPCAGIEPLTTDTVCRILTNSYDPNDKLVFVDDREDCFDPESDHSIFTYTIRFQNTGNDTADRVMIIDTLNTAFDIRTLNLGPASHFFTFEIVDSNILIWIFEDIRLPDSITNPAASQGSLQFSIRADTEVGELVTNNAAIYFDANPPIFTPVSEIGHCISHDFSISAIVSNATCEICNGQIDITIDGESGPYTYNWSPFISFEEDLLDLCSGTYTVFVSNIFGETETASFTVGEDEPVSVSFTTLAPICGLPNGEIDLFVAGGQPPYTYSWTGPAGPGCPPVPTQNGLPPGGYAVTITDAVGCTNSLMITLDMAQEMTISETAYPASCGDCNGSIDLMINAGTPPYSFNWSNGSNDKDQIDLCPGSYQVTVNDANGCTLVQTSVISEITAPEFEFSTLNPSCTYLCDGMISIIVENGTAPYSFEWFPAVPGGGAELAELCSGDYEFTVTDASGCTLSASIHLNEPAPLELSTEIQAACFNSCDGQITVFVSGGTPPYEYQDLSDLCPGDYQFTVTDAHGCLQSQQVNVAQLPAITLVVDSVHHTTPGLADGFITINPAGGIFPLSFAWKKDGIIVSTEQNPSDLSAGTYFLEVTDAELCMMEFGPFTIESLVSWQSVALEQSITVFPNPAKGIFSIQFSDFSPATVPYRVFDVLGNVVLAGFFNDFPKAQIQLSDAPEGLYLLKLSLKDQLVTKKILLVK